MVSNAELQSRREAAVPHGVASFFPVFAKEAENAEIWDVEGKRYIDFASGIAVLNVGHRNPRVMELVRQQLDGFTHTCFQVTPYESYVALAETLNRITPGKHAKKTIFLTTGAEATENAIKIARGATKRTAIISFVGGFHGRTMMALAMTGKVLPYKAGFGPFPNEVYHVPFPIDFHGITTDDSIKALHTLFKADVDPKRVAAMIIEPVQGEGGFYIAPPEFLKKLREICDEHGILLVADEVQTGFARTGSMFGFDHSGVVPDLICTAKSLAGGFPLSAVTGRAEIMDAIPAGGLGGTYGGSPIACAAAQGVVEVIEKEDLCTRANEIGKIQTDFMRDLQRSNSVPFIGEVRGLGAMVAFELVTDRQSNQPAPEITKKVVTRAKEKGLIILSCGVYGNVIRSLVPLTVTDEVLKEGLNILKEAMVEVAGEE